MGLADRYMALKNIFLKEYIYIGIQKNWIYFKKNPFSVSDVTSPSPVTLDSLRQFATVFLGACAKRETHYSCLELVWLHYKE